MGLLVGSAVQYTSKSVNAERSHSGLKSFLDGLFEEYHRPAYLSSDPLEFVHRYSDQADREAVAVVAALLAYGNVKQIRRSVEDALSRMEKAAGGPSAFVERSGEKKLQAAFQDFVHRFNVGKDVVALARLMARSRDRHGSVGGHLMAYLQPTDEHFGEALSRLIGDWKAWARKMDVGPYFFHLLTAPSDGSCCKRWCMLLRWMGRKDELDPGLWPGLRPDQLILPLDTHTGRICGYLGLTERKVLGWKAAVEITRALKSCDPSDPTRYDFALARLGILDLCQRKYRPEICRRCQLVSVCRFAREGAQWKNP